MPQHVMKVGNVEIVALLDTSAKVPCSMVFPAVGHDDWARHAEHLEDGDNLPLSISSYLVRGAGKTVLVDTGIGAKDRPFFGNGRLPDALAEAGVQPGDIDLVLATHIHIDHVGWHTTKRGDAWVPTFPRAKHIFNRAEYDYFTAPAVAADPQFPWVADCVLPLRDAAEVELVGDEAAVTPEITLLPSPGHTPAHTSFLVQSAGESALILGDVAHNPAQITEPGWQPIFDMDPAQASATRAALAQRIQEQGWRLVAGHFAHPGFGRVVLVEGKRYWRGGL